MKKLAVPFLVVLLALSVASSAYLFTKVQQLQKDPQAAAQAEVQALITEVGQLIVLPPDETPTVATVSDPEQLKAQAFFTNAEKGDKVLLYTNAKKAVLYNPTKHKIVEVAPVNIGSGTTNPSPSVAGDSTEDTTATP